MSGIVQAWFGDAFAGLHPQLRALHQRGGVMGGDVEVAFGTGLAGAIGRRLARRLGVPTTSGIHRLEVEIRSDDEALHWNRTFDGRDEFRSSFVPAGNHPTGFWLERSGAFELELGVDVIDGGWHWQHRATRFRGLRMPKLLHPATSASKRVDGGLYRFAVDVRHPLLGRLFAYSGNLSLVANEPP